VMVLVVCEDSGELCCGHVIVAVIVVVGVVVVVLLSSLSPICSIFSIEWFFSF